MYYFVNSIFRKHTSNEIKREVKCNDGVSIIKYDCMNWQNIKNTLVRPEFFRNQSFGLKEGLRFYSFAILAFTVATVILMLPGFVRFVQTMTSGEWQNQQSIVKSIYPDELKVTLGKDGISTNVAEPYAIALPKEWRSGDEKIAKNLLVIDTTRPVELGSFEKEDTLIIIGKHQVGFRNPEKGEFRIQDLGSFESRESFILTATKFQHFVDKAFTITRYVIVFFMLVFPFMLYAMHWIGYLFYALFGALIVWLAATICDYKLSYGRAYLSTLYLLPIPLVYDLLTSFMGGQPGARYPFLFSLILFIVALINFPKMAKPKPVIIAQTESTPDSKEVGNKGTELKK